MRDDERLYPRVGQKRKSHSLIDKVYSRENLARAWKKVKENHGVPASRSARTAVENSHPRCSTTLGRVASSRVVARTSP